METLQQPRFLIMGAKLTYTLIDLDYIIRYKEKGVSGRLISARRLNLLLSVKGEQHFVNFVNRAYRDGDETVCKLRSGLRVSFTMRDNFNHKEN